LHDQARVLADLASAIANDREVISDFPGDAGPGRVFGSVPTAWRALEVIARSDPEERGGSPRR
jgi:hypothetical protein